MNGKTRAIDVPAGFKVEMFSKVYFNGKDATYTQGEHVLAADFKLSAMRVARDDVGEAGTCAFCVAQMFALQCAHLELLLEARLHSIL